MKHFIAGLATGYAVGGVLIANELRKELKVYGPGEVVIDARVDPTMYTVLAFLTWPVLVRELSRSHP